MPVGVVDFLEVIEIEEDQAHRAGRSERPPGLGYEETPIEDTGQFVARRQAVKLANGHVQTALACRDAPSREKLRLQLGLRRGLWQKIIEARRERHQLVVE